MHPDRWQGHAFGQGRLDEDWFEWTREPVPLMKEVINSVIQAYVADPMERTTLQTYSSGDLFRPEDHADGTIIAFDYEALASMPPLPIRSDWQGVEPAPIPDSPLPTNKLGMGVRTLLETQFADPQSGAELRVRYADTLAWGIVVDPGTQGAGVPAYIRISHLTDGVQGPKTVVGQERSLPEKVGTVGHWQVLNNEILTRINRIEVCTDGWPWPESDVVASALRRLSGKLYR